MPAEPAMICAYLTERAAAGLSVGTIDLACGAFSYRHRMHGLDDPILTEGVRQVRRGLRRIIGAAPRRQDRPLGTADIRTIADSIDRSTALGARDAAIILLGFASALRRSELAALNLADVEHKPGGVLPDHPPLPNRAVRRRRARRYGSRPARCHRPHHRPGCLARRPRNRSRPAVHQPAQQGGHTVGVLRKIGTASFRRMVER